MAGLPVRRELCYPDGMSKIDLADDFLGQRNRILSRSIL